MNASSSCILYFPLTASALPEYPSRGWISSPLDLREAGAKALVRWALVYMPRHIKRTAGKTYISRQAREEFRRLVR